MLLAKLSNGVGLLMDKVIIVMKCESWEELWMDGWMERFKGGLICCLWCALLTPISKNRMLRGIFGLMVEEVIGCYVPLQ